MNGDILNLTFEGGGVLGYAYIGALQELFKLGKLDNVKNYSGSSIGAVFAALMACGADKEFIDELNFDAATVKDAPCFPFGALWGIFSRFGFYKGDTIYEHYKGYIKKLTGRPNYTFGQLYEERGKKLYITGSNLSMGEITLFYYKTHADMPIALAMRISSSYPYVFRAITYGGDIYTDGGLYLNYPIGVFDKPDATIGLKLISKGELGRHHTEIKNVCDYTKAIIIKMHDHIQRMHVANDDWRRTIKIDVGDIPPLDFNIEQKDKQWLINQGIKAVDKHFGIEKKENITIEIIMPSPI